ncbi:uncharacterized protein LOC115922151 [Strongylocentrotus purpuratus]|uniref:EGF-like domain-containing protein n=1 Tax=Strongylocentrotus purpuratus TaxID=7668 RepID=A0A7M7NGR7_STRPU|nr:uncharacterized protein LOC115922151 [Strongylocentrotus purpuratus]
MASCPMGISRKICSGNGVCAITGECVCFCGWSRPSCSVRNSTREGVICIPKSVFVTSDVSMNPEAPPTDIDDTGDEVEVRVLTSAIIGGSLAIIFVVAIIFGATSIGFKRARKNNQARRMQQVKLFSMFQPTEGQKKRLAKFGGGRSPYIAGELEAPSSSMGAPSSHPPGDRHHHKPKHHNHHGGGQPGGRMQGKNKGQKKMRFQIDMDTHKPHKAGGGKARTETII